MKIILRNSLIVLIFLIVCLGIYYLIIYTKFISEYSLFLGDSSKVETVKELESLFERELDFYKQIITLLFSAIGLIIAIFGILIGVREYRASQIEIHMAEISSKMREMDKYFEMLEESRTNTDQYHDIFITPIIRKYVGYLLKGGLSSRFQKEFTERKMLADLSNLNRLRVLSALQYLREQGTRLSLEHVRSFTIKSKDSELSEESEAALRSIESRL